jgi:hypothetical protein
MSDKAKYDQMVDRARKKRDRAKAEADAKYVKALREARSKYMVDLDKEDA